MKDKTKKLNRFYYWFGRRFIDRVDSDREVSAFYYGMREVLMVEIALLLIVIIFLIS